MARHEHGDDGDEVVGELALLLSSSSSSSSRMGDAGVAASSPFETCFSAVNHESHIRLSEEPLEELHAEPCKAVCVGNHNLSDTALVDAFQKGRKAWSLPVEA